jgi:NAD+ diphosphatase
MQGIFRSRVQPLPGSQAQESLFFIFRDGEILLAGTSNEGRAILPRLEHLRLIEIERRSENYLGELDGSGCYAVEASSELALPDGWSLCGLRSLYGMVDDTLFALAGRALQIVDWDRNHRYCGRCGEPTVAQPNERARKCPACGLQSFPRLSPAVIVVVERDGRALLARGHGFQPGVYSCIAGFVEPGETLEQAVAREIEEETGITVREITYFGSQPWPFPNSLMIGFTARYRSGEIVIDETEIADAGWFAPDEFPNLPGKISIARRLIDDFLRRQGMPVD